MLGSAVVVFRETLEAALIVAIVMGASRGVAARGRWIAGGVIIRNPNVQCFSGLVNTGQRFHGFFQRC